MSEQQDASHHGPAEPTELKPRIIVFGVGGAGGNAINNMIAKDLDGVEFVAANTDAQALRQSKASVRLQMGSGTTKGLGAGARPDVGAQAAEESFADIQTVLDGANMCFITAGMGGGTGTGSAPVIARAARELGVLTVGVVTKPFAFEGARRMRLAEEGLEALQKVVDTLIIIPNQNLFRVANERTSFSDAFVMADDVLYQGVKGVTDLMVRPGLVNLDFADVRAVMDEMGKAMMGSGEAEGERRALEAAERAIDNPLLDEVSLRGAKGVLINITGGFDMKLFEVDEAANLIRKEADADAAVFFGSALDPEMEGRIRVSVVATGILSEAARDGAGEARRRAAAPQPKAAAPVAPTAAPQTAPETASEGAEASEPAQAETADGQAAGPADAVAEPDAIPAPDAVFAQTDAQPTATFAPEATTAAVVTVTTDAPLETIATPVVETEIPETGAAPPAADGRSSDGARAPVPPETAPPAAAPQETVSHPPGAQAPQSAAATAPPSVEFGDQTSAGKTPAAKTPTATTPAATTPTAPQPAKEAVVEAEPAPAGDSHRVAIPSFLRRHVG